MAILHQKDSLPGKVLGNHYTITEMLGSGGVCDVYLGTQGSLFNRKVAVRVLKKSICLASDPEAQVHLKHFLLEAELLTRLKSPCFVKVFDSGVYRDDNVDRPYVVLEHLEGPTAWEWARGQEVDVRTALLATIQIGEGLEELGRMSLAFRDLKPANMIWELAGAAEPRARLFDLTHVLAFREGTVGLAERLLVGVPPYAPPEQAQGECGAAGDVWSLGALAYFLMEGRAHLDLLTPTWEAFEEALNHGRGLTFNRVGSHDAKIIGSMLGQVLTANPADRKNLSTFLDLAAEALCSMRSGERHGLFRGTLGRIFV